MSVLLNRKLIAVFSICLLCVIACKTNSAGSEDAQLNLTEGLSDDSSVAETDPLKRLEQLENQSIARDYKSVGELVATHDFEVQTADQTMYKNGLKTGVNVENSANDILTLVRKDSLLITTDNIILIIDYPLTQPYEVHLQSDKGFTKAELAREICKHYQLIYAEEEKTATVKTVPVNERTTLANRNQTNGIYGVWGHDLVDIQLSGIAVYETKTGEIVVVPYIES